MSKKLITILVSGLLLATFVSYAFAQCNVNKQGKEQKVSCCPCCCCNCAK